MEGGASEKERGVSGGGGGEKERGVSGVRGRGGRSER